MVKRSWLNGSTVVLLVILAVIGFSAWKAYAQGPGGNWSCGQYGPGMMGGWYGPQGCPYTGDGWNWGGPGMMGGPMMGMMGGWGAWTPPADLAPAGDRLTLEEAVAVAQAYVAAWDDPNLVLGEVMQFDNHFYADVMEADSGRGAFEFLIAPADGAVVPEPGPNMMWNLRYGMHAG